MEQTVAISQDLLKEYLAELKGIHNALLDLKPELRRYNEGVEKERIDPLYTGRQAAKYLKRSPQTISRMIRENRLHKVVRGGLSGILKSELDEVRKSNQKQT